MDCLPSNSLGGRDSRITLAWVHNETKRGSTGSWWSLETALELFRIANGTWEGFLLQDLDPWARWELAITSDSINSPSQLVGVRISVAKEDQLILPVNQPACAWYAECCIKRTQSSRLMQLSRENEEKLHNNLLKLFLNADFSFIANIPEVEE